MKTKLLTAVAVMISIGGVNAATADPLPNFTSNVTVTAGVAFSNDATNDGPLNFSTGFVGNPGMSLQFSSSFGPNGGPALISPGGSIAVGALNLTVQMSPPGDWCCFTTIGGLGFVGYSLSTAEISPPPASPLFIPILFNPTITVTTQNSNQGGATLEADAQVGNLGEVIVPPTSTSATASGPVNIALPTFGIDSTVWVALTTNLIAGITQFAGGPAAPPVIASATIDPTFTFDQATFDATMGANTFPLDQYFRFEVSPNVSFTTPSEVPLPGTLPFFASGLGALGLLGWRRKRKAQAV